MKQAALRGKKRSALLAGLDIDNIIQPEETPPSSSAPASSYSLRTQARERSELCYDQKYHPIDDFTRPKRAAKMRLRYGEPLESDSELDVHAYIGEGDSDESDSGNQTVSVSRRTTKGRNTRSISRFSVSPFPSTQPPRRASQHVNREVVYNMDVHPQDNEIFGSESENEGKRRRRRHRRVLAAGNDSQSDADSEQEEDADIEEEVEEEAGLEVHKSENEVSAQ